MEQVQKRAAHKSTGTLGGKICSEMLSEGEKKLVCPHADRQHSSSKLFGKNGRYKKPINDENLKVYLDVPSQEKHPIDSGMDSIPGKQRIGLGVSKRKRLERVETLSHYISQDLSKMGNTKIGPICYVGNVQDKSKINPMLNRCNSERFKPKINI